MKSWGYMSVLCFAHMKLKTASAVRVCKAYGISYICPPVCNKLGISRVSERSHTHLTALWSLTLVCVQTRETGSLSSALRWPVRARAVAAGPCACGVWRGLSLRPIYLRSFVCAVVCVWAACLVACLPSPLHGPCVSVCASRGRAQTRAAPHDGSHTRGVHGAGAWGREDRSGEAGRGSRDGGRGDPAAAGADDRVSRVCVCDTAERARPSPAVAHTPVPKGHCARARAISFFSFILYCVFSPYNTINGIFSHSKVVKP